MRSTEAGELVGRNCWISSSDGDGEVRYSVLRVESLQYIPLYGAYVVGNSDEVCSDRVSQTQLAK